MQPSMHLAQLRWHFSIFFSSLSQRSYSACRHSARSTSLRASRNAWTRPRAPPSPPNKSASRSFTDSCRASAAATVRVDAPAALSSATRAAAASAPAAAPPSTSFTARAASLRWRHGTTRTTLPCAAKTPSKNASSAAGARRSARRPVIATA